MNCSGDNEKIHNYLKGRMDSQQINDFESHLKCCENCRCELEQEKRLNTLLATWEMPDPRLGFQTRLKARVEAERKKQPKWFGVSVPAFSVVSAIVIVSSIVLWHTWPMTNTLWSEPKQAEVVLVENFEIIEKLDMLQQWEMIRNWDEINAIENKRGKI